MSVPNLLQESPGPGPAPAGPRRPRLTRGRLAVLALVVLVLVAVVVSYVHGTAARRPPAPQLPTSGYAASCLAVGAAANVPGQADGTGLALFQQAAGQIGPLTMRRSFDQVLPASFAASAAGGDAAAGVHSFVSWKPPGGDYRGAAAGRYDRRITAWARSVPRTGIWATAYHEPENDMKAADFVAFQRHVYTVVKAANPTIHWGPVYSAYWWDPSQRSHYVGDPAAWWPGDGYADFVGLDWYGRDPEVMTTSRRFLTWYHAFAAKGLPLVIPEYGQYFAPAGRRPDPEKQAERARDIRQDGDWILAHPQFKVWMYWEGGDPSGQWRMRDAASKLAWRSIAERGCPG